MPNQVNRRRAAKEYGRSRSAAPLSLSGIAGAAAAAALMLLAGASGASFAQASAPAALPGASIRKPADTAPSGDGGAAVADAAAAATAAAPAVSAPSAAPSASASSAVSPSSTTSLAPPDASAISTTAPSTPEHARHGRHTKNSAKNSAKPSAKAPAKLLASAKSEPERDAKKPGANGTDAGGGATGPFSSLQFSGNKGPIDIKSDSLDLDYKANVVTFRGHVHASQADALLTSNSLTVTYGKDFHEVKELVANDNVRISQGTRWATGDRAVLDQARHTVVLTGNPVVHDGEDQVTGSKITVHLETGKSEVEGARAVFFPSQQKTRDNNKATAVAKSP